MTSPDPAQNQRNKACLWSLWTQLAADPADTLTGAWADALAPDVNWHGFEPIGSLVGVDAVTEGFWRPFVHSFTNLRRETHLFFGGQSNGRADGDVARDGKWWVTGTGLLHATFANDYLSIPATDGPVSIRWGEFCCFDAEGFITNIYFLIDLIDLLQQTGVSVLPPARGADRLYPPPAASDGILSGPSIPSETSHSLDHIRAFIFDGLNAFDESDLASMGMARWFHPDVRWYGPGGIGACLSFEEFESLHQAPWLVAFPDRQVQDLDALFAEGDYSGAPGWSGVKATHTGAYLGVEPTGNTIAFNGLDWWKRDGDVYIENWVFVDMIHLFQQFDIDLLGRIGSGSREPDSP